MPRNAAGRAAVGDERRRPAGLALQSASAGAALAGPPAPRRMRRWCAV